MKNAIIYICTCAFAFFLGWKFQWDTTTLMLFLYSTWAFIRIGQLQSRIERLHDLTDESLNDLWEAFTRHVKHNKSDK